jgi:pimeloyl-ACP methyl ester carboxylesterase
LTPTLPAALAGERRLIPYAGQRIAVYLSPRCLKPESPTEIPLVLVHGVNAAASAAEVKPLFDHYAGTRPVLAVELPGFGSSDRLDRKYQPELMAGAILAALAYLQDLEFWRPVDVIAVSLSCEFVALASLLQPKRFRSVALISPTGLEGWRHETRGSSRPQAKRWLRAALRVQPIFGPVFNAMTSRQSLRWYMQRVWGWQTVDRHLLEYAYCSAHQPGARFAPLAFLAGALSTPGARDVYRRLSMPVWLVYGSRGTHTDCSGAEHLGARTFWRRERFGTGALPFFEATRAFTARYDAFSTLVDTRLT